MINIKLLDEVERRHHKETIFTPFANKRRGTDAMSYCSNGSGGIMMDANRRKKLFRAQNTLTQSLTNSESNLRLMDDQDNSNSFNDKHQSKASLPSDNLSSS